MSIESAVYTRMANLAAISALVSTRIYPQHMPQKPTYPAITYRRLDGSPFSLLGSDTSVIDARFEIVNYENTFDAMINLSDELRQCWQRYSGTVDSMVIRDTFISDISNDYNSDLEIYEGTVLIKLTYEV